MRWPVSWRSPIISGTFAMKFVDIQVAGRESYDLSFTFRGLCGGRTFMTATHLRSDILEKVGSRRPAFKDIREMKYLRAFQNGTVIDESISDVSDYIGLETFIYPHERSSKVGTTLLNKKHTPYRVPNSTRWHILFSWTTDLWGLDVSWVQTGNERLRWMSVLGASFRDEYDLKGVEA
ncbi:hypothetical protein IW262DRAFT_1301449 [Armillaria fumosa]|nr:hypothetical protein IW262DRAFT_1301449 [Armillaria fumosa]